MCQANPHRGWNRKAPRDLLLTYLFAFFLLQTAITILLMVIHEFPLPRGEKCRVEVNVHNGQRTAVVSQGDFSASLTELRVLSLFAQGLPYKEVAEIMGTSGATVRHQLISLRQRNANGIHLPSRTEVAIRAYKKGLLFPLTHTAIERLVEDTTFKRRLK